jgi:hypothetical protein
MISAFECLQIQKNRIVHMPHLVLLSLFAVFYITAAAAVTAATALITATAAAVITAATVTAAASFVLLWLAAA